MFPLSSINVFLDSSSSSPSTSINRVFTSFHGPDVRVTFLSHLRKQFNSHGITMYENQWRRRRQIIAPALAKAIRESRISIVVLSKNYASSSWYLDELLQILKCKENIGQIVMTVFCGIDPYDVWNQTGDFGKAFHKTCAHQKEEKRERWSQALKNVGNIAGEHFRKWDDESELIEKIASEISRYFEGMVGLETHLDKIQSLLHLDNEGDAMIVGICGPAGIGKTTIARALHSRLSCSFRRTCFMENLRGSYNSGLDEYGLKLHLQEQLLSKILNRNGMRIYHLGELKKRLCDQKVLIILDDVNDLKQLEALADKTAWFGPGSRIVVITEDQELLQKHGINGTYHVNFPSSEEALQILCKYAFDQRYPPNGFQELAERVVGLCDNNLPSSLSVVGSSLCGRKEEEWDKVIRRLEHIMDHQDIEEVLRVVFEPSSSNKRIGKGKHRCFTCMAFLVIFNFLLEIASAVVEHLSSIRKPYFARISVAMSFLSVILSILDLFYKIRDNKARFRFKWPIPWFYYYPKRGYRRVRILGNFTDTVLLFCAVGGFIVSTVNWRFIEKGREGPIKASVWPLFFAIGMVGMVVYEFIQEKPSISKDYYWLEKIRID